jgi:WS/DGAT/MGAT family acyltransferase
MASSIIYILLDKQVISPGKEGKPLMSQFRQLHATDTIFIASENVSTYNHTAGLMVLDPGDAKRFSFGKFRKHMAERVKLVPQFFWKMHEVPAGLDLPYWVEDEAFSIDRHIRRIALPEPGNRAALGELAGLLYSRHLDRRHPLWEMWYIEGLAEGKVAVMMIFHHCLMDGQSAIRLLDLLSDAKPNARARKAGIKPAGIHAGRAPSPYELSLRTTLHLLRSSGKMTESIATILLPKLLESVTWKRAEKKPRAAVRPPFAVECGHRQCPRLRFRFPANGRHHARQATFFGNL